MLQELRKELMCRNRRYLWLPTPVLRQSKLQEFNSTPANNNSPTNIYRTKIRFLINLDFRLRSVVEIFFLFSLSNMTGETYALQLPMHRRIQVLINLKNNSPWWESVAVDTKGEIFCSVHVSWPYFCTFLLSYTDGVETS